MAIGISLWNYSLVLCKILYIKIKIHKKIAHILTFSSDMFLSLFSILNEKKNKQKSAVQVVYKLNDAESCP